MILEYISMCAGIILLFSFPLSFYVMFMKLDSAEHYMQHSTYISEIRHFFRHYHFDGRFQRLYAMATVILIPKVIERRGMVSVEDVKKIPTRLKYWMVIPSLIALTSLTTMVVSGYFAYY